MFGGWKHYRKTGKGHRRILREGLSEVNELIYLDNAATTLKKPEAVAVAVYEAINSLGNPGRGAHEASLQASRTLLEARALVAKLINAESESRIAFTYNATEGLNTAIKGLLNKDDTVVTTCLEHNSVLRPLYETVGEENMIILGCDKNGMVYPQDFENAIRRAAKKPKAIVCTHASNVTGNVVDIKGVGKTAKEHGILFIADAAQTAGSVRIDVRDMNIDVLCFTGHKSLFGPQGTGGIYVREGIDIRPLKTGGGGTSSFLKTNPVNMPGHLEAGTMNAHGIAGLKAALSFVLETGVEEIHKKESALTEIFVSGIADIPGIEIYGDLKQPVRAPIVSLNMDDLDSALVCFELEEKYRVFTRTGAHCAPLMHEALGTRDRGVVRFSFSYFNTEEEALAAADAIRELKNSLK